MNIRDVIPYRALATGLIGAIPIVYRVATGNEPPFLGNPTPTSYIPTNIFEQVTTGALFPATAGAIVGKRLLFGSERHSGFAEYLTYAIPAVLTSLAWGGIGVLGRYAGVEDFERPGLIPFDATVAATLSTGYAYLINNTRKIKRALLGGLAALTLLGSVYGYEQSNCKHVEQEQHAKYDAAIIISGGIVPKPNDFNDPAFTFTKTRMKETADLYEKGLFEYVVLTGTPEDIKLMSDYFNGKNIPYILSSRYGTNTTEDLRAGFEQIPRGSKVAIIAGKKQINRTGLISRKYDLDFEENDGYFGVDDTDMPDLLGGMIDREHLACVATRVGLEKLKGKLPFQ